MMNRSLRSGIVLILGLTFASAAFAVPVSPSDGGGTPAAPEPGLMLMAVLGLVLGGGYIAWRRRRMCKSAT